MVKKHKKAEHMSSFNLSKRLMEQKQSTRSNTFLIKMKKSDLNALFVKFEFCEDYVSHVKQHEIKNSEVDDAEMAELLKRVYGYLVDHHAKQTIGEQNMEKKPTHATVCGKCNFKTANKRKLKIHIQTMHQDVKIKLNEGIKSIRCDVCEYTCKLNIQIKKHKKKHGENQAKDAKDAKEKELSMPMDGICVILVLGL